MKLFGTFLFFSFLFFSFLFFSFLFFLFFSFLFFSFLLFSFSFLFFFFSFFSHPKPHSKQIFDRAEVSDVNTRFFDLSVKLTSGHTHKFQTFQKAEYSKLFSFLTSKKLRIGGTGQSAAIVNVGYAAGGVDSSEEEGLFCFCFFVLFCFVLFCSCFFTFTYSVSFELFSFPHAFFYGP